MQHQASPENGKPSESWGRKATGLKAKKEEIPMAEQGKGRREFLKTMGAAGVGAVAGASLKPEVTSAQQACPPTITAPCPTTIQLELTPEQVRTLSMHTKALSHGLLIIEVLDGKTSIGQIKTAAYSYYGDTCCV